ncbi:DUF21 domain-containing protein [Nocardioidaceae bacterium]|nr:DUF21 domain-containing protein [Nocardioidaceae bacterium]
MDGLAAIPVTILIIALSAFFVSVEFSAIAARRTRLESAAAGSRAARAALRNSSEVSVLLAGSQLGITACTLALGAVTEPAIEHAIEPVFEALGLPVGLSYAIAFAIALVITTFLHLVVGEMAPKSIAIAHPERSATIFALPMRAFMFVVRPALLVLNEAANALVRRSGVEPVEEVAVEQDPEDLRALVEHSAEAGDLDAEASRQLASALGSTQTPLADLLTEDEPTAVSAESTVGELHAAALESGHLRILVGSPHAPEGVVHLRDTLTSPAETPVGEHVRELPRLDPAMSVLDATVALREQGAQIALVERPDGRGSGVVTMADLLARVMPASAATEQTPAAQL